MLAFEHGRSDYRRMTDIQLCEIIDRQVSVRYGKSSVYELSLSEKNHFANYLYEKYHCADSQLRRCLVMHL
jgi:hypothetical protein